MFRNHIGGSKIFQKEYETILGCLDISNLVNTIIAKFIK